MATMGIDTRHARSCRSRGGGGRCNCIPTYQASVFDARQGRKIRKTFPSRAAAKTWRQDALVALRTGKLAEAQPKTTMRVACDGWIADARRGVVRTRSGDLFKPSTIRAYDQALRLRVYPMLADVAFYRVRRVHLQDLVDQLLAAGVAPATINTTIGALGAIYSRAVHRDELEVSPTTGVKVPAPRNGRERFATPDEAVRLLAAVPERDRATWATALYAGLRRGELMALRWTDMDLKAGTIDVARSWDMEHGPGDTKNRNRRRVPIASTLREHLAAEQLRQPHGVDLCFGLGANRPFRPDRLQERADDAWDDAKLERLTLHDCRHTFASLAIAAGVNAKALSTYMGHSGVSITLDRYGHLMPGNEAEAATLLDAYLSRVASAVVG
jgi:integrase